MNVFRRAPSAAGIPRGATLRRFSRRPRPGKALLLALALALTACVLTACGGGNAEPTALSFKDSASIETIQALKGKPVVITGYMATLSPLDGSYIYLMNLPYQSCPFCVPNTQQLANTMAVYAPKNQKFTYTDRPVRVTGRLELGDFADEYGYTYNYRLADATWETVDLSKVSEDYALYAALAEDGAVAEVDRMFNYLLFTCQWTEYQSSGTDDSGNPIVYYLYPGDAENALADTSEYGYGREAAADYFPGLVRRVRAVNGEKLEALVDIIEDAAALEAEARADLSEGRYTYDSAEDKYALDRNDELYDRFYEIYGAFTDWLTQYEL